MSFFFYPTQIKVESNINCDYTIFWPIHPSAGEKWCAERVHGILLPPSPPKNYPLLMDTLYSTVTKSHYPLCWPPHAHCSPSLFIPPHTDSAISSTGWPFQPCLCPRWILTPHVSLKLDCFFPISLDRKWPRCQTGTDMLLQRVDTI